LWLLGGQGGLSVGGLDSRQPVNAVILIFFDHKKFDADSSESITGDFEVWRRNPAKPNTIKRYLSKVSVLAVIVELSSDFSPLRCFTQLHPPMTLQWNSR